ncbi:hypothetical protein [Candidatus Cytomitobacter primus]|uniref:Uncharacterized protein n=1 Tax=Candidatus Cytomitobacter primus TaxID=2066024 RepID=A0A5C0UFH2_9PROT|nr:hypothetical protein [Candidatus Cytomitobacter primus]QEK38467.1 hypothetical protein FZC34_00855 [Candidatus Cytomitobacter primus]
MKTLLALLMTANIVGKNISQDLHILFFKSITDYDSDVHDINLINRQNINLANLRHDFPFFSIIIDEKDKSSYMKWICNFCILSFANSKRTTQIRRINHSINSSIHGFILGLEQLQSLDQNTFSQSAKKWINKASLWVEAYKKFEVKYDK